LNKDRSIDGVDVAQPTCIVIHEEYDWELEQPWAAEDHPCLSVPPLFFFDLLGDLAILDFSCVSPSTKAPTVDHSQDTPDVSPSSDNGEDQSFFEHPLDFSSIFSGNAEDEHSCFSSTPLCDSSNHEDADQHPKFFDLGCRDLFTSSSDHEVDSLIINPSKPLVYDDPSINEVETS